MPNSKSMAKNYSIKVRTKVKFNEEMQLRAFPFDLQDLNMQVRAAILSQPAYRDVTCVQRMTCPLMTHLRSWQVQ